ncbi:MAG TPA: peptidoglycan -binding protein [Acetobacteraceae bacterium]|nr:peptidoglycan -binding protein [Acetobacteraceae bacterium]
MALSARRRGGNGLEAWPGYVDALSTLLMVIIFVLLVFVLGQAFLSVALSGRDKQLDRLNRQVSELSDMLSLARGESSDLKLSIAQLNHDLTAANAARDSLTQQLAALRATAQQAMADRDALKAQRDQLSARLSDAQAQLQSETTQNAQLQTQLADVTAKSDASGQQAAEAGASLAAAQRQLAATAAQLAEMKKQMAALDQTVTVDKATIQAKLSDLAKLAQQVQALTALRDQLEAQAKDAAARAMTEKQKREAVAVQLADEQKFSDSARAQIALLNQQLDQLRAQLASISAALDVSEKQNKAKDVQIANLGSRLNAALATKVQELQQYRSEFFGRLRQVLANRPGIQIVGDRFVFQSEVLFPVATADLTPAGVEKINELATTLKQISAEIPTDLPWILRVDGHADKQPISDTQFASNWELSAQRAINVVKLLIADGIPPEHLAATAFAQYQPLVQGDTTADYAKNRRIELRLTDR